MESKGLRGGRAKGQFADEDTRSGGWTVDCGLSRFIEWASYRDRLYNLLLMCFGSGSIELPHNVRHPGLVADKGSEMARIRPLIWRERLDFTTTTARLAAGHKGK